MSGTEARQLPRPAWRFGEAMNFFGCGVIALDSMGCIPLRACRRVPPVVMCSSSPPVKVNTSPRVNPLRQRISTCGLRQRALRFDSALIWVLFSCGRVP
jgi:hypothetical protein